MLSTPTGICQLLMAVADSSRSGVPPRSDITPPSYEKARCRPNEFVDVPTILPCLLIADAEARPSTGIPTGVIEQFWKTKGRLPELPTTVPLALMLVAKESV